MLTSTLLAEGIGLGPLIVILVYLLLVGYLGYLGWVRTKTPTDYLVAGRKVHPFVMALSYGATFISTSAIVGFGGVAGMFGMSLLWLTFLNIFAGIFIAFVLLAGPARRMGHHLDAHTFPELLGRRYQSKFIQVLSGLIIFLFIPLYAAAVLIGGCVFIAQTFGIDYNMALFVFSVIIAMYVIMGGLKGVMYTDALQGSIMFVGMLVLLIATYAMLGGVTEAHTKLTDLGKGANLFSGIGFKGWTSMPKFGWGWGDVDPASGKDSPFNLWWIIVSTITMGVGIGVLAQPQLVVRFMTVRAKRELNRAALVGGIFILIMTGVAFTVGSLSNVFFLEKEEIKGTLTAVSGIGEKPPDWAWVIAKQEPGINQKPDGSLINPAIGPDDKALPCVLLHIDTNNDQKTDTHLIYKGYGGAAKITPAAEIDGLEVGADPTGLVGSEITVKPRATAYLRAIAEKPVKQADETNRMVYSCSTGRIIPLFIAEAMPKWFGLLFLLTLLAAAMSTLSSQFHALGTSISRDVYEQITGNTGQTIGITRIGVIIGIVIAVIISYLNPGENYIIARATAIFFGLCASAFLPAFLGGLFCKWVTRAAAKWSMIVGFLVTAFWLVFVKDAEARALGICHALTGKWSLLLNKPNWPVVDPIIVALPISIIVLIAVSMVTQPPGEQHLNRCFKK
ncbi:MAG: sodium:solute symporter family protein [Sedimentisphaerales bacterium]|nr:sodium:solute symporter family protein [Sedimentisphaerales bacterium]